ncbi:hypothetical protein [Naasia sp. SYSU D00948]|uniref:hypothetical protein n=1 Tax=Naasia sp. SYSU D00948 TaxID=2817379 RepID=UPI001B3116F2|nr:hypothetical protein [Naasia sp. SYSU D00948]
MAVRPPEPNASLPLRWSRYGPRQAAGAVLIVGGAGLLLPTTAYTLHLGLLGAAAHVTGWLVLPAPGWRRLLGAGAGLASLLLLLLGGQLAWLMAVPLALWFLVRRRPARAYPLVLAPVIAGLLIAQTGGALASRVPAALTTGAVAVAAAWAAAVLPARSSASISRNSPRDP